MDGAHDLVADIGEDFVVHVGGKLRLSVGAIPFVIVLRAHLRIDEQAQVRIIHLDHVGTRLGHQFRLAAQQRHHGLGEGARGLIDAHRTFGVPHPFRQQRRRRQRRLDETVCPSTDEGDFISDDTRRF